MVRFGPRPRRVQLRARPREYALYGDRSLLITNLDGLVSGEGVEGFYFENTRLLSRLIIHIDGERLSSIGASSVQEDSFFAYGLLAGGSSVYAELAYLVGQGMRLELNLHNYGRTAASRFELSFQLDADFADIREREKKGQPRRQEAEVETVWDQEAQEVRFRYCHPGLDRLVAIRISGPVAQAKFAERALALPVELSPGHEVEVALSVEPLVDGKRHVPRARNFNETLRLPDIRHRLRSEIPALTSTNATVARAWRTATEDLASLALGVDGGPAAPAAGMPLYQQIFGRDMLTIGWQALLAMPTMLRDVLLLNAAMVGSKVDDWHDEEPGKVLDQARNGPIAALDLNPFHRYYGDVASPADFLIMLGQYFSWTNDRDTLRDLYPTALKILGWLERSGDLDGDGFIEYVTRSSKGIKNQGWKDGDDAIVDAEGRIVPNPIAVSEVQAYFYAGLLQFALAAFFVGDRRLAFQLLGRSRRLKRRFHAAFWMERENFYAMALDAEKQPVRSIGSNTGQVLATGIVPKKEARALAHRLMAPDMFSGWGIRTLSSDHAAYDPLSYHRGCVWPVEAGTAAFGLARYGCFDHLHRLTEGLFAASDLFVANRLPETLGGFQRDERHPHPGFFPASCEPQGWSAGAIVLAVQALLGMQPVAPLRLLLIDPHLPAWLTDIKLEGIRVGNARVDLQFWRTKTGRTRYRVLGREGRVYVVRQPVPDGLDATALGRLRAALGSALPWWARF